MFWQGFDGEAEAYLNRYPQEMNERNTFTQVSGDWIRSETVKGAGSSSGASRRSRRGEILRIDFSPSIGNEIRDEHPAGVVSCDHLNDSNFGKLA